tara:strand:- start:1072 stop:1296 length:225 start_codon:yes stop_codon:yes gene_type:complete
MSLQYYVCSADLENKIKKNNGFVDKCDIRLELPEGKLFHCPTCAAELVPEDRGPSVGELLRKGLEEEKKKGMHK